MKGKKHLTNTSLSRILYVEGSEIVDASAEKLVNELVKIRRRKHELDRREAAIRTALDVLGIRVDNAYGFLNKLESKYADNRPFRDTSLPDACLTVLADHDGVALDKNQVEYYVTLGGYPFNAKDPTNSIEVTLRKLAAGGECAIDEPGLGSTASRYSARRDRKEPNAVANSRTTTGPK